MSGTFLQPRRPTSSVKALKETMIQTKSSTHKTAMNHASNVFVPRAMAFDPKINGFPGFMVEHFYVKYGDPSCIGF